MFYGCWSLKSYYLEDPNKIDISNWKVTKDKILYFFYYIEEFDKGILLKIKNTFKIGIGYLIKWNYGYNYNLEDK